MKKGFIRAIGQMNSFGQPFGIFEEGNENPVTTHFCSHSGYAEGDLLRHSEAKEFDIIYGLLGDIVYMNGDISDDAKKRFNDAENGWWIKNYGKNAPTEHTFK